MKIWFSILLLSLTAIGCASKSEARLREQNAYLAGQNAILTQHQAQTQTQTPVDNSQCVTIVGQVQNAKIPFVTGLTLAQAIATANYTGADQPQQITITRNGETASVDVNALINGANIPLEVGDTVEIK